MKFQQLIIHNIASIEDAVINFDAQPLAHSEVFLITGKTGAGKSTILDAICLALYAKTPRLYETKMQGDTKDGEKTVKIDDTRQLMRRNTGEAYVLLTFVGSNQVHYEATWSVARARKKVTGNMQPKDWQLKNLDTNHTLTKDKEIEAEIRVAIGLDFNQFCRTTMLAQGEFTRFLNSKDDEKAEILEKITGVDVYSRIGAKVYAITGQKEQIWKDAQRLVEGTRTLTDAEITEKQDALAGLDKQYNELKASNDKDTAKRDWIKQDGELSKAVKDAKDALQKANEVIQSDGFKAKEAIIKEWRTTIDARRWMAEMQQAEEDKKKQKEKLEALTNDFTTLLSGQLFAEKEISDLIDQLVSIETFLDAEREKANAYENAQTIASSLYAIANGRETISKNQATILKEQKALTEELQPAYEKAKAEAEEVKEALAKETTEVKRQEDDLHALNLTTIRTQRDEAKELMAKISTAKERLETLATAKLNHEATSKRLAEQKTSINTKTNKSTAMEAPIHDAKKKMDDRKEVFEKQKDTIDRFASTLRLKLHVGDTCPVCRQTVASELPHEEELSALVSELQEAYNEAEKAHKALVDAKLKLEAEIQTETTAYNRDLEAFNKDTSVVVATQKASDACKACGLDMLDDNTLAALDKLNVQKITKVSHLESQIKAGEIKETEIQKLRRALEEKHSQLETLATKVLAAEKALNDCKGRISTAETLIHFKENEVRESELHADKLIMQGTWGIDWKASPKEFAESLLLAAKKYSNNTQQKQSLSAKLETKKSNFNHVASAISSIINTMPQWKTIEANVPTMVDDLLGKASDIANKVSVALNLLRNKEEVYHTNKQLLDQFFADNESLTPSRLLFLHKFTSSDIAHEDDELKRYRDEVVAKKTLCDNAHKQQRAHQEKQPELTETDEISALQERIAGYEKNFGEIAKKKGAILQELNMDKENKDRLSKLIVDAENKKADYQKWAKMNQLIGDATGNKFRKIAQSYVLASLIHTANNYMKTLTDRYTLKVSPGTFVISLEDAYQGFVSRAASTLSGGESFLVSLSLALALSDIGQTLSVDTLFIDEGFGTLSGEPLQNAINTLRSLHSKAGRHVGIISHVEELQERIPVQIQVNQEGNNSSSKIKIIPEVAPAF